MFNILLNLIVSIFLSLSPSGGVIHTVSIPPIDFNITGDKAVLLDDERRVVLFSKNSDQVQAIASITKLMTALVFLEHNPGWDQEYEIEKEDIVKGGRIRLYVGDKVTVKDLFNLSLIASDNGATLALVKSTGLSEEEFVKLMNEKAKLLGLDQTHFVDPIGLSENNISSAREIAYLAQVALDNEEIRETVGKKEYEFKTSRGIKKKAESTDSLLFNDHFKIIGGKTGYTNEAGYCFVSMFEDKGENYISVVLNSKSKDNRFKDTNKLINWVLDKYEYEKN